MTSRFACAALGAALVVSSAATAQTVVARVRTGNATEGIAIAGPGRYAGDVIAVDTWDVIDVPIARGGEDRDRDRDDREARGQPLAAPRKIFDLRSAGLTNFPNAIASAFGRFYFTGTGGQNPDADVLVVTDESGRLQPSLHLTYASGVPNVVYYREGLSFVPATSHFLSLTVARDFTFHVESIRADGLIESDLALNVTDPNLYLVGIAWHPQRGLLVSGANEIFSVDAAGNLTTIATVGLYPDDLEGLAAFADGRLAAANLTHGRLYMLDSNLRRLRAQERDYRFGAGVTRGGDSDFDPETGGFLILGSSIYDTGGVYQVTSDGEFGRLVAGVDQLQLFRRRSVNWSAFDQQIVLTDRHDIYFLDPGDGHVALHVDENALGYFLQAAAVLPDGRILALQGAGNRFHFYAHAAGDSGTQPAVELSSVKLARIATGGVHLYQAPDGTTQVISGNVFFNLDGSVARSFDPHFFDGFDGTGLSRVFALTGGPWAGNFAYGDTSGFTIFSLP